MNAIVPFGFPASVEVTYSDPSLFVGLQLYDDSGVSPIAVGSIIPMLNWIGSSYRAQVSGTQGKWYIYRIAVYTDGTYTTVDSDQPNGSGSMYFQSPPGAPDISGTELVALVDRNTDMRIEVDASTGIFAFAETGDSIEICVKVI